MVSRLMLVVVLGGCVTEPTLSETASASTVGDELASDCSTAVVMGLATQIAQQANCDHPGHYVAFDESDGITFTSDAVLPYLEASARDDLRDVARDAPLHVNSALRTLAQQYLLYQWFLEHRCGITAAAEVGTSNHEGGRAVDLDNYDSVVGLMSTRGWAHDVPGDDVHFDHLASPDNRGEDVSAFQVLWNLNHPDDPIAVDGDYGPDTEARLEAAPADGFAISASCRGLVGPSVEQGNARGVDSSVGEAPSVGCNAGGNAGLGLIVVVVGLLLRRSRRWVAVGLVVGGCGHDAFPIAATCNPLGVTNCMAPWPSSAFEIADASSPTGRRLAIPDGTLPTNSDGQAIDPARWNLADGFSPAAPIVIAFPEGVAADGLTDLDASLAADSPTVILDLTTGERVAHFAEIDEQTYHDPAAQALFLRPAARLIGGHRYAVAITKRVRGQDGNALPIPPGFTALVDHMVTSHPLLEAMRPRFPDVLDALANAGFPTDDLVVAWDFTVASDEFLHRDMIAARDRTLSALATQPIAYTIASDAPIDDGAGIRRKLTGTIEAPLFLSHDGDQSPGTVIVRDDDGLPTVQGFYAIPFTAIVPACAYTANAPVAMVMYGHGLMGNSVETAGAVQSTTAEELCMVFVGTDMRGMSGNDLPAVARMLNDLSDADEVFEKLEQGLANHVTLVQAMRTTLAQTLFVDAGRSLVDPTQVYYYGLSQGGIFGAAIMAYEPTIMRAALGVGAANYSMLLERSNDWPIYRVILNGGYPDSLDDTLAINLMQMRWDKVEASGIANTVLQGTGKQLLLQNALSDDQVTNLATYWEVRSLGIPVLGPTPFTPWGTSVLPGPLQGSALVLMDGGAPPPPSTNVPANATGMHDLTRNQPAARRQIGEFFRTGQIIDECAGACVCESGACN